MDPTTAVPGKATTTVAIDFGRITVDDQLVLYLFGVNGFPGTAVFANDTVRDALALPTDCPLVRMDARESRSCLDMLIALVEHALGRSGAA